MKKIITIAALLASSFLTVFAQKTIYNAIAYSESSQGKWSPEKPVNFKITIDTNDAYIEVSTADPEIFHITKSSLPKTENGKQITEYICNDNEAMDCKVQIVKSGDKTKIYFIYDHLEYYYSI